MQQTLKATGLAGGGDVTRAEVRYLQQQLNASGYGHLVEDGIYGPKTAAAYARFEARQDLPAIDMGGERVAVEPPLATPAKPWWQSRAILGLLASLLAMIAGRLGWSIDDGQITEMLLRAVELGGLALAAWGTIRRSAPIDPTLVARVGARDVRLPVRPDRAADGDPRGVFRDS